MSADPAGWGARCAAHAAERMRGADPAHDLLHVGRVVATATRLAAEESADLLIVLPAAWLHDLVDIPKDDPRRTQASRRSADAAVAFLRNAGFPADRLDDVRHAIEAHSFSAKIDPKTKEAEVVQDADRLEALGAIGIARCFATGGAMRRTFYDEADPFGADWTNPDVPPRRPADDAANTLDHFWAKLFHVAETLRTPSGRREGARRAGTMRTYLMEFRREIGS